MGRAQRLFRIVSVWVLLGTVCAPAVAQDGPPEDRTWTIKPSLRVGYVGAHAASADSGRTAELDVDTKVSPGFGVAYALSPRWSVEADIRYDLYLAEVNRSDTNEGSDFSSLTVAAGPVLRFSELPAWGGVRPLAAASLGYRHIFADLAAPVEDYDPAWGVEAAVGLEWEQWELRLGYARYRHDAGDKKPGTTRADDLDLSEVFLQAAWTPGANKN